MSPKIRHAFQLIGIVVIGSLLIPVWIVTSIIFGRDTLEWFEQRYSRRKVN